MIAPANDGAAGALDFDPHLDTCFLSTPRHARVRTGDPGALRVVERVASPRRSERTRGQIAQDRFDAIGVRLAIRGIAHGEAGGRVVASLPGTILLLDFGQPFVLIDHEERAVVDVLIPRVMLERRVVDPAALHGRVIDREACAILAAHLEALAPRLSHIPVNDAQVLGGIVFQLVLPAIGSASGEAPAASRDRRHALFERARAVIDARLASEDLTPEWLVATLNVSRSELYHVFEEHGGVARFVWRRRLEAARAALIDPRDTRRIGAIAFAYGFTSEAHFARAYRQAFGKTASESRRHGG